MNGHTVESVTQADGGTMWDVRRHRVLIKPGTRMPQLAAVSKKALDEGPDSTIYWTGASSLYKLMAEGFEALQALVTRAEIEEGSEMMRFVRGLAARSEHTYDFLITYTSDPTRAALVTQHLTTEPGVNAWAQRSAGTNRPLSPSRVHRASDAVRPRP